MGYCIAPFDITTFIVCYVHIMWARVCPNDCVSVVYLVRSLAHPIFHRKLLLNVLILQFISQIVEQARRCCVIMSNSSIHLMCISRF